MIDVPEVNPDLVPKIVMVPTRRVILGHDEGNAPDLEPLFVNNMEVMRVGTDVYIDVGIVKPEEVLEMGAQSSNGPEAINFYVLERLVISVANLERFIGQAKELLTRLTK
jgi:hypothetical protein